MQTHVLSIDTHLYLNTIGFTTKILVYQDTIRSETMFLIWFNDFFIIYFVILSYVLFIYIWNKANDLYAINKNMGFFSIFHYIF